MITYRTGSSLTDMVLAYNVLQGIDEHYPDFNNWWLNKCMPAIDSGRDTMMLALDGTQVIGVALVKNSDEEKKLRCVRVLPAYHGKGVAIRLIEQALKALGCDKPLTSVPEALFHEWSRILVNHFGFVLTRVEKDVYRKGRLEYFFNDPHDHGTQGHETPYGRA